MSKKEVEVIARGVCVGGGKLLLCRTRGAANTYLPGGHIDFGESAPDSLVREIREEMGLDSEVKRFLGACEHTFIQKGKRHCEINLVFEVKIAGLDSGSDPVSCEDYIEFLWADADDLEGSRLEPASLRSRIRGWIADRSGTERWAAFSDPESH